MNALRINLDCYSDIGSRSLQQDSISYSSPDLYSDLGLLAVLCDGLGGMQKGERYSAAGVRGMMEAFETVSPQSSWNQRLYRCFEHARSCALAEADDPGQPNGGTTLVAVLIHHRKMAFVSSGDSRLYLYRKGGLIQLNREHVVGGRLDESAAFGYISFEDARNNKLRSSMLSNLCDFSRCDCDMGDMPIRLQAGDRILLLSDGVFSTLTESEIAKCVCGSASRAVQELRNAVSGRHLINQDNNSAIIITVDRKENN